MGFVTGAIGGGGNTGLQEMPVALVNQDAGELGQALVEVLQSPELAALLDPTLLADPDAARGQVDDDQTSAAVIIPAGFTESIIPATGQTAPGEIRQIEVYANPARPTSAGIIQTIVEEYLGRVEIGRIGGEVAIAQMVESGRLPPDPQALAAAGEELGKQIAGDEAALSAIRIEKTRAANEASPFNIMAYMAPGMALLFLMFAVSYGGRSLLTERAQGTLPRLLVTPTAIPQVLAGKVLGIFLTGSAQMAILIAASSLMFGLQWGDPLGVAALILAAVFGSTGWGVLLTAIARTPAQAANLGTAMMLIFGVLGGSFFQLSNLPGWIQIVSQLTPNHWGIDGFTILGLGGWLGDLGGTLLGLFLMGVILFGLGVLVFNRSAILQK
jgi:ABC-2 type transport system permease protein